MNKFYGWKSTVEEGTCVLLTLENYPNMSELSSGSSCKKDFPKDALFRMDKKFRKNTKLADQLSSETSLTVVNSTIANIFRELNLEQVEILPVSVLDHKGDDCGEEYFIINPNNIIDCIDINSEESQIFWHPVVKEMITGAFNLVLKEDFDKSHMIFRPKYFRNRILIREDLAEKINSYGLKGLRFVPIDELI